MLFNVYRLLLQLKCTTKVGKKTIPHHFLTEIRVFDILWPKQNNLTKLSYSDWIIKSYFNLII